VGSSPTRPTAAGLPSSVTIIARDTLGDPMPINAGLLTWACPGDGLLAAGPRDDAAADEGRLGLGKPDDRVRYLHPCPLLQSLGRHCPCMLDSAGLQVTIMIVGSAFPWIRILS
jgi:hypothetical protein